MSVPRSTLLAHARRLGVTPAEVVAIAVLVAGAVAVGGLVWSLESRHPAGGPVPALAGAAGPAATATPGVVVSAGEVIVHVAGAVRAPGVYTLAGGSRVGDALTAAGGPTRRAALDGLNLARVLTDGEQILVPDERTGTGAPAPAGASGAAGAAPAAVSLNQATPADLETLPGIGPVLAERIIQHRDSIGGFTDVGELRDVPGIGEKTFQALAELVTL